MLIKSLKDNGFVQTNGKFIYQGKNLTIEVSISDNIFRVYHNGKIIKEGCLSELPLEYEVLTRKEFIYPVKSALIKMEVDKKSKKENILPDLNDFVRSKKAGNFVKKGATGIVSETVHTIEGITLWVKFICDASFINSSVLEDFEDKGYIVEAFKIEDLECLYSNHLVWYDIAKDKAKKLSKSIKKIIGKGFSKSFLKAKAQELADNKDPFYSGDDLQKGNVVVPKNLISYRSFEKGGCTYNHIKEDVKFFQEQNIGEVKEVYKDYVKVTFPIKGGFLTACMSPMDLQLIKVPTADESYISKQIDSFEQKYKKLSKCKMSDSSHECAENIAP